MRNPNRIPAIIHKLEEYWLQNPDLRLGQLIVNAVPKEYLYSVEDTVLVRSLVKTYAKK